MGISTSELIVVFLVVLILFGPEQLPTLAKNLGKLAAQVRKTSDSVRREFYNSIYTPGQDARKSIDGEISSLRALKVEVLAPPTGAIGSLSRGTPLEPSQPDPAPSIEKPSVGANGS